MLWNADYKRQGIYPVLPFWLSQVDYGIGNVVA